MDNAIAEKPNVGDLEKAMLQTEGVLVGSQTDDICKLAHHFAPGVYGREITIPAGMVVVGHRHKEATMNVVLSGHAWLVCEGDDPKLVGPGVFVSQPGVRKAAIAISDFRIINIHPTEETDLEIIEGLTIDKSEAFMEAERLMMTVNKFLEGSE